MKILSAMAVMAVLLLYVWERVDIVQVGYQTERLKARKMVLQREHDELRVKVSALTAPERIAKVATERLGMTQPRQEQVVLVRLEPGVPAREEPAPSEYRLAKIESGAKIP